MTLLEKLNLEPGAVCRPIRRSAIIQSLNLPSKKAADLSWWAYSKTSANLTNAEFLAACEEWLTKN